MTKYVGPMVHQYSNVIQNITLNKKNIETQYNIDSKLQQIQYIIQKKTRRYNITCHKNIIIQQHSNVMC